MNKTTTKVIEANHLAAGYGSTTIWADASFSVHRGEFLGLLGPNGAGKTTLFRLLLGLQRPTTGSLKLFGQMPRKGSTRIGYVPQRRTVDTESSIEALEYVRLGVSGMRWGLSVGNQATHERREALSALLAVDADGLAHRVLHELSGGELQRVFLAQALVGHPDLLLLDEPLANLDIRRETELIRLVAEVATTQRVAVLLIAHDVNPLLPVADRIIYIANGRVATGKPREIVTSKTLSALYDAPIEVLHDAHGRYAVLGVEEAVHHHEKPSSL